MKTSCFLLIMLCLILVSAVEVMATPVSPGGLVIEGRMYVTGDPVWDPDLGEWVPDHGWWSIGLPFTFPYEELGDPQDLMYHNDNEIGVRDGIYAVPLGNYESSGLMFLGHVIHIMDFTIRTTSPGAWPGSENLRFDVGNFYSDDIYWSATGPFSSEPVHAYIEFPNPVAGYEVRLTVVPEASPFVVLLSGVSVFGCCSLRSLKRPGLARNMHRD